ncbi:PREDICTED: uncharacterized protein LOC109395963 [Hipposideros armiger]|uniref:Uncharacterized protein LOC109395963 n=1 Tax=Hipposideros armiger TaxID=186990 RepID=A0A8B7TGV5_HIPAR|nr:PREDICTED: uncharacterized protein LOC109395963 [Hipposideros armiger]
MTLGAQKTFNTCELPPQKTRSWEMKGLGGRQCLAADPTLSETVSFPASAHPGPGTRFAGLSLARYLDESVGTRRNAAKALGSEGAEPPEEEEWPRRAGTGPRRSHQPPRPVCARGLRSARSLPAAAACECALGPGPDAGPRDRQRRLRDPRDVRPGRVAPRCPARSSALEHPDFSIPHLSPGVEPQAGMGPGVARLGGGAGGVAPRGRRSRPACRPSPISARPGSLEEDSWERASPRLGRPGMQSRDNGSRKDITEC